MKTGMIIATLLGSILLSGCAVVDNLFCTPHCHTEGHASSSLVDFLYPNGQKPPASNSIPQLQLPLRVGLAFLPSSSAEATSTLDAAHREQLLERIRSRFKDQPFVSEIVVVPDYYLTGHRGFEGLEGVQRLYRLDLLALVSYDQVSQTDDNAMSLGYLSIVGAYVLPGTHHEVSTLVDLAVVDPVTHSLVLRAGGTSTEANTSTLIGSERATREGGSAGFSAATDQMMEHFDRALTDFQADVRAGKAPVRIVAAHGGAGSVGAGAFNTWSLALLSLVAGARMWMRRRGKPATTASQIG